MSSCLGLYIQSNLIKYAKVTKEREMLKIESFGIKFYDKLGEAIKQIVSETFSFKTPISINMSEDMYNYFYMFNLLNKNDLKKAIDTEFESYCFDKNLNKNAFETRFALCNSQEDKDKIKVIHVAANKANIAKNTQTFDRYRLSTITPIGTAIPNVANIKPKENILIVNMEETTTITTIVDQKIYHVDKIDKGAEDVLSKISSKENSTSKAYEICKNSTIYTMEGKELQEEENEYLEDIMPTLHDIVLKVQDILANSTLKINKVYLTGTLSVVNNIDLYFQEFLTTEKCEILKPYFVADNIKINIRDYIEVNSAIAVALQGLGYGIKNMNFKNPSLADRLPDWLKIEIGPGSSNKERKKINISFQDLKGALDATEKWMLRVAGGILVLTIIYTGFSMVINKQLIDKQAELQDVRIDTETQLAKVESDTNKVKSQTTKYTEMANNLKDINQQIESNMRSKNVIPNLLMKLMTVIPEGVQLTEVENTNGNHIIIKAQSKKYEQLGYFKAKIKEDNILSKNTVVSTQGEKQNDFIKITIEGDLP